MPKVIYENILPGGGDISGLIQEKEAGSAFWLPGNFPADVRIDWEIRPVGGEGALTLAFSVKGEGAFFLTYYRRRNEYEKSFHTCALVKNPGQITVAEGGDPLPDPDGVLPFYGMSLIKRGRDISFYVNDLRVLGYHDDGASHGDMLTGGNIGFSMSGNLEVQFRNMKVTWI